jgi:hypothetical protein
MNATAIYIPPPIPPASREAELAAGVANSRATKMTYHLTSDAAEEKRELTDFAVRVAVAVAVTVTG